MIYEITNDIEKIRECLNEWKSRNSAVIKDFKIKEYENIFASIYSFEHIIVMLDKSIEDNENKKIPDDIIKHGEYEYKLTTEIKMTEKFY